MTLSFPRVLTVARREFLTAIRRKAFFLMLVGLPAYIVVVTTIAGRAEEKERAQVLKELSTLGVVDSSGLFAGAPREIQTDVSTTDMAAPGPGRGAMPAIPMRSFTTKVLFYPDQRAAEAALRAKDVSQVLVVPADYLQQGRVRRYARGSSLFSSADRRAIAAWLAGGLVQGHVAPEVAARVAKPAQHEALYTMNRRGEFELKDDRRELVDFMLPFMFTFLLGMCIVLSGQYLLQGLAEEKENRILESLMCMVSAEELMTGKLLGLGAVGLFVMLVWVGGGLAIMGPTLAILQAVPPPSLIVLALVYFVFAYLFFGSIMTGIGAVTNNMREAQQFSVMFSFANFIPILLLSIILARPSSPIAVGLSLFPPTAAPTMLMRMSAAGAVVPPWQIALSLALLAGTATLTLFAGARVFRVALLMYGKTPNLPEILRWARQG